MPAVHLTLPGLLLLLSLIGKRALELKSCFMHARPCINNKRLQREGLPVSGDTIELRAASLHIQLTYQPAGP